MRHTKIFVGVGLLLLLAATAWGSNAEGVTDEGSFWIGGRLIDTSDYSKKVGEYRSVEDDIWPEFGLHYQSATPNSIFYVRGHYFDKEDMFGLASTKVGDIFSASFRYNSFLRHTGQDMLENIQAREWLPSVPKPSGKTLTHDVTNPGADYSYTRKEVLSKISALLSRERRVRLSVAHRMIMKEGTEESLSNSHCFGCHIVSEEAKVENQQHDFQADVEHKAGSMDVGYQFGYRHYKSSAPTPMADYDQAKHPVFGTKAGEFGSRLNFDNATLPASSAPVTEKISHKARVKGKAGKGRFASALSLAKTKNKMSNLTADSWAGVFNYALPLSPKSRLVAKVSATGVSADDPWVDVESHRAGKPNAADFDHIRYSALDRSTTKFTAEYFHRLNPKMTLSVLAGYDQVARKDYPVMDDGLTSSTITGQAKIKYRKGMRHSATLKYRFEKTSDPFVSGRGLFESDGRETLDPIKYGMAGDTVLYGYFYYLREDLKYQAITTEPTDYHEFDLASSYRPSGQLSLNLKAKMVMDKNGDLDSLDVEHNKFNSSLGFTFMPNDQWAISGGFGYGMEKSRGPVSVALFDG